VPKSQENGSQAFAETLTLAGPPPYRPFDAVTVALQALAGGAQSTCVEKNPSITTRLAKVCRSSPLRPTDVARLHETVPRTVATPVDGLTEPDRSSWTLLPAAWHRTDRYANNRVEADHGRLKARLGPMRGRKQDRSARIVIAGHAFVPNRRRGRYELAVEEPVHRRLAPAFDELALAI
jgi:hypothetical protein